MAEFRRSLSCGLTVSVDDLLDVVVSVPKELRGRSTFTVTNVEGFKAALDDAHHFSFLAKQTAANAEAERAVEATACSECSWHYGFHDPGCSRRSTKTDRGHRD
jgi:hypothetical protein